jgi:RimJ/RimL family protein N-acetyltransferase
MTVPAITTERLRLEPLVPEAIEALLAGDASTASRLQGIEIPELVAAGLDPGFLRIQLDRMRANPDGRGWCARLIVDRDEGRLLGHCGFHGPPEDVGRAEIGYSVFEPTRNRGLATEAARALLDYARDHGADRVFASTSPDNAASQRVIEKLGFVQTGTQIDEIDGEELVFEVRV